MVPPGDSDDPGELALGAVGQLPGEPAAFRPAPTTPPADPVLRPAVLVVPQAAVAADGLPPTGRHLRLEGQPLGFRTHSQTHLLPRGVVAVAGADQRVGNLVQQRVPNDFFRVVLDKVGGQLDGTRAVAAEAQVDLATVEAEGPAGQPVGGQQFAGQGSGLEGVWREEERLP